MVWMLCVLAFIEPVNIVDRYQAHIQFLADDLLEGRETSYRGQRLAARYLATQLALIGATSAFPNSDKPYFQTFQVVSKGLDETSIRLTLSERGHSNAWVPDRDFWLQTFGLGDFDEKAPMVFVGYGFKNDTFDEYAGIKVKDRWVVILEDQPEGESGSIFESRLPNGRLFHKLITARSEGALGVIMLRRDALKARSGAGPKHRLKLVDSETPKRKARKVFPFISVGEAQWPKLFGRDYDKFLQRKAAIAIKEAPQSFSLRRQDLSVKFSVKEEVRESENVLAVLPGTDPVLKDEYVVVSAHYDHIGLQHGTVYNGADDNASGTTTLLMLAKDLAVLPHKRSLLVLFVSGEESGLLGSQFFIEHSPIPLENIVADINMDMIGRNEPGEIGVIPSKVKGISTLNLLLDEVNRHSNYQHILIKDMDRYHKRSDHYNFTKAKIPSIFFFAGVHDDYHGPDDDWQKLDYQKLSQLFGLIKEFLIATLDMPNRPEFLDVPEQEQENPEVEGH